MKRRLLALLSLAILLTIGLFVNNKLSESTAVNKMAELRKQHQEFLDNSPFKETLLLSKKERKALGIPPNKYAERMWELTMDPAIGKPAPERLFTLQKELKNQRLFGKVPGGGSAVEAWEERGPDNVGGRTRAIMYDPNDATNKRVFAGGVSGGLWVNNDITDENSAWILVDMPQNLAISCITSDPNNSMVFYVGTGESYVPGEANGNGVWKSTDGGLTWSNVFGGVTGDTDYIPGTGVGGNARITVNSPGSIAGEYYGMKAVFGPELAPISGDLVLADDSTGTISDACEVLTNGVDISGNIAVIYRGDCNFTAKVKNAQDEGAIGVLMINNIADDPIPMGGEDDTITIPSVMISMSDGQTIVDQLVSGVNISISPITSYAGYLNTPGVQHINDIKVRDIGSGNSEVYVAAGSSFYGDSSPSSLLGVQDFGLYKSTDEGSNWSKISLPPAAGGYDYQPNDIEIDLNNTIWFSTTTNVFSDGGGEILASTDGVIFTLKHKVTNGGRSQIATSGVNAGTIYVLTDLSSAATDGVEIIKTTDDFATVTNLILPEDADTGIPANDFTRAQASYDLMLEVDPANDDILYVGGIDLFRSGDSGLSWDQISKWSNNNNLAALAVSYMHADQHALTFHPTNSNQAVFGNDGGVYYGNDLSGASSSTTAIGARNKNYNTLQFYRGAIGQEEASEKILGGAQDNGSQLINNASMGVNSSLGVTGGDGGYAFIDKDNEYMISSIYYNRYYYLNYSTGDVGYEISNDEDSGDFINPAALDSDGNYLYTNGSSGTTYLVNSYELDVTSATLSTFTDGALDGSPTAFKVLEGSFFNRSLYVGTENGKLFKVSVNNSGSTWTEITGNDFTGSISSIAIGETEDDIFVTFYNYGVTNIFYSADGGTTWQNKEGNFPDIPVRDIMMNPLIPSEVIIATDLGVWATSDITAGSPDWFQSQNGMKDVIVMNFDLRTSDNTVLATTYGRGFFTGTFTDNNNADTDGDGILDSVDNCPTVANADQADIDNNGIGDVCQDTDGDGVLDIDDNCPTVANPDQADVDNNGIGDVCEDSDGDGVIDIDDNCPTVANPNQADGDNNGIGDVCDTGYENPDNITLEIVSETCSGLDNGIINIEVNATFVNYTATLIGNGLNMSQAFTSNLTFDDIPVGSYMVCVEVDGKGFMQCFEINIDPAEELDVIFDKKVGKTNTFVFNIAKGTGPFDVRLDGKLIETTSERSFELKIEGSGLLEVSSAKTCEGVFKKTIEGSNVVEVTASPNPVINDLIVTIPGSLATVPVEIYNTLGQQVYARNLAVKNQRINVPFESFNQGIYFLKVGVETPVIIKIVKK